MQSNKFNPKQYKGDNVQIKLEKGIARCFKWDGSINEYRVRYIEARKKGTLKKEDRKCFQDLKEAKHWLYGIVPQSQLTQNSGGPKFKDVVDHWLNLHVKFRRISTQRHYRDLLKGISWFSDRYMDEISPEVVDAWLLKVKSKEYRATRCSFKKELKLLKLLFNHYKEYFNHSHQAPIQKKHSRAAFIKEPTVKNKDLLEQDFLKFRAKLEAGENGRLYAALATLQYYCSLRISEAAGVFKEDLKFGEKPEENRGIFHRALKTSGFKGDKPAIGDLKNSREIGGYKTLPLHPEIKKYVEPIAISVSKGAVFKIEGEYLSKRQIEYRYNLAFEAAGLEFRGTHVLRHGSVRDFFSRHGDMGIAKMQLGVKSMKTVEVYAQPLQRSLDQFVHNLWDKSPLIAANQESEKKEK